MVYCHLHPNMSGSIVVTPTEWSARPSRDGGFGFPGVPPGRYTVVAWHKSAGFFRQSIEVSGKAASVAVNFEIPLLGVTTIASIASQ